MIFGKEQLKKFADLVRIEISEENLELMDINSIVNWLDKLQKIDTTGIEPMLSPVMHSAPVRADIVTAPNIRDCILNGAPDKTGAARGYFAVPQVMEE